MTDSKSAESQCDSCAHRSSRGGMILPAVQACSWVEAIIHPPNASLTQLMQVMASMAAEQKRCPGYRHSGTLKDAYLAEDLPHQGLRSPTL